MTDIGEGKVDACEEEPIQTCWQEECSRRIPYVVACLAHTRVFKKLTARYKTLEDNILPKGEYKLVIVLIVKEATGQC